LYSKLMCWVALDRAVALADHLGASDRVEAWKQTQDQIREAILTRGWSDRANAFTQSFGSDELDASSLMLPLVGLLPADNLTGPEPGRSARVQLHAWRSPHAPVFAVIRVILSSG
jgi:GH15 family glucan-1,4-alpha-glucosidase